MGVIEPINYSENFHDIFVGSIESRDTHFKIRDNQGRSKDEKHCDWPQNEEPYFIDSQVEIELANNASKFAIFSTIRSIILEANTKLGYLQDNQSKTKHKRYCCNCTLDTKLKKNSDCCCYINNLKQPDEATSETDSSTEEDFTKDVSVKVPQIVGAGLRSLCELISDARNIQPNLCTKALKAVLDVIQGQHPESFRYEPDDLINPLYDLLLDLATLHGSNTSDYASMLGNWSSVACSALLGLCVARGDTGKILKAIAALIMSPKLLSTQIIQLPAVLSDLQRTVLCVGLKKPYKPDFHSHGVPKCSLFYEFNLKSTLTHQSTCNSQPVITCDGKYLYLLSDGVLIKIGSGFGGTHVGHVYAINTEFSKDKGIGWLGFCENKLYYKRQAKARAETLSIVNTETLSIISATNINIPCYESQNILFADEDSINIICTNKDESLIMKQLFNGGNKVYDLPLKLSRKKFRTLGYAAFEEELLNQSQIEKVQSSYNSFEPKLPKDIEIIEIACGKEFGIIRGSNGKVYYYGKSSSLGLKCAGRSPIMNLTELVVSKNAMITQVAIGHDGVHALLANDDGTILFTGTARRGEDGDTSKNRRQPKAIKPKKLSKIDGQIIVYVACNNGTSAFVTKTGKIVMFGKDAMHCDSTGFVTDLLDQNITKIALGKAHCVALNSKGEIFTFGLNNKGQCGRVLTKEKDSHYAVGSKSGQKTNFSILNICDYDEHTMIQGQCRICTICKECTGYNISCVSLLSLPLEKRHAGSCLCGQGDAGCSKCGACSACITLQEADLNDSKLLPNISLRQKSKNFARKKDKYFTDDNVSSDLERDTPRVAPLSPEKVNIPTSKPVIQISCGLHHTVVLTSNGQVYTFGSNQFGQLGTGDLQAVFGPVQVKMPGIVKQVAAGSNHTVVLTQKGVVYTFGNFQKGQLGRIPKDSIKHQIDSFTQDSSFKESHLSNILLQRQKFLWNCSPGSVLGIGPSFGKKATWISASGDQTFIKVDESLITTQMLNKICIAANKRTVLLIPLIPLPFQILSIDRRDGNCYAHNRNQENFLKMMQDNADNLSEINQNIASNSLKRSQDRLTRNFYENKSQENDNNMVDQRNRRQHEQKSSTEQLIPQLAFALDPLYEALWVFNGNEKKFYCYNPVASELHSCIETLDFREIISPKIALSQKGESLVSRSQASLNLLACLDLLTSAQSSIPLCFENSSIKQAKETKERQLNEYQVVNRFENFGGGWGYSGHSVEAIRFMVDTDVVICGFGMFGGRGEYSCKIKLYDLGSDGGGYEKDGTLISETKDIPYECPARSKYHIMLPKPINASAGKWFLVYARIAGPSSDCGSSGQSSVTTEDQIVFNFKTSKKANNGTDVNSGQIPSIIYRLVNKENKQSSFISDYDPIHKISKTFASTVTKECFDSLVLLLNWSWQTFITNMKDIKCNIKNLQNQNTLEYLILINKFCLRLLRKYINDIYPFKNNKTIQSNASEANKSTGNSSQTNKNSSNLLQTKINTESIQLAESIGNVRALFIQILCSDIFMFVNDEQGHAMIMQTIDECHKSFVFCFDAFYPTSSLKWNCLCELLSKLDKGEIHSRLLSAVLAGLCSPSVKLKSTFCLLNPNNEFQSIISPSDNAGLPMLSTAENHQYPILVEQIIYRTQQEKTDFLCTSWGFKDVLVRLLDIVSNPIRIKIENVYNKSVNFNELTDVMKIDNGLINNCCKLLSRVLAEIVYQTAAGDLESTMSTSRSIHSTPCRFARCDVSRTWNTGNFGPDAIAFSVDRSGIAIAGAALYTGSGSYDYQLELLYDNTEDSQSLHKWETLESISGSYDQESVHKDMAEIKFERPIHIKENSRYALRLCSQGARTCSGDAGVSSVRGPCGTTFSFFPCDLSFNGTTTTRGQIPSILYYSTPIKSEGYSITHTSETTAKEIALQIVTDITKKCTELLILARNTLAASLSPSDKSPNSSDHTQTIDSEHNITPIEEHFDITWTNNSRNSFTQDTGISTARDITKRIESFSKGLIETFKFDKRKNNPFDFEIEIGETEIHPMDLIDDTIVKEKSYKNERIAKLNGNEHIDNNQINSDYSKELIKSDSEDSTQLTIAEILESFNLNSSNMFHILLPLIYAQIGVLACNDPKSSVHILNLIKEVLPHISALNQLYMANESAFKIKHDNFDKARKKGEDLERNISALNTTSNYYAIIESDHPYKSSSVNIYRVEFPPCVQWMTIEFDNQSGTAQLEDQLSLAIPLLPLGTVTKYNSDDYEMNYEKNANCKNASIISSCFSNISLDKGDNLEQKINDSDWIVIKKFNSSSNWPQNSLIIPGNKIEFSLETASLYAQNQQLKRFGFKCLVLGYDIPFMKSVKNSSLIQLEHELAYLGGMCCANLMRKDLQLPDDISFKDLTSIQDTLNSHFNLLSKGLALSDPIISINQTLETHLPVGSQSNERQFLKDFISGAPGSSGARLSAWLQPESRLDPNKCELNTLVEPVRFGWPTKLSVTVRDQYGDKVIVPNLKVEIKATPVGPFTANSTKSRQSQNYELKNVNISNFPPRISYEPTIKEKMCYKAITFMKSYSQYSFEELRFNNPIQTRTTENLQTADMEDGTFNVSWTPSSIGLYCLTVIVDGIALEEMYRVEVKEGGNPPPLQKSTIKKSQPPSKLRKFIAKNSSGLRIRSHPTLQSEQVGIVKLDGIISFIDEIENDDGVWVRLSTESIRQHCTIGWYPTEAWCLQYNQHLGKTLLYPIPNATITRAIQSKNRKKTTYDHGESGSVDTYTRPRSSSPNRKGFDFSKAKLTPPLTSEIVKSSTNPFIFSPVKTRKDKALNNEDISDEYNKKIDDSSTFENISTTFKGNQNYQDPINIVPNINQPNITSAIAGVGGGSASKFQAIQKWFKGESMDGRENSRKTSDGSDSPIIGVENENQKSESKINITAQFENITTPSHHKSVKRSNAEPSQSGSTFFLDQSLKSSSISSKELLLDEENTQISVLTREENNLLLKGFELDKNKINDDLNLHNLNQKINDNITSEVNCFEDKSNWEKSSLPNLNSKREINSIPPLKQAIPPSLAESLRAVFAALLWHEGLVHDAMACASFLKFHPSLPKQGALVTTRKENSENQFNLSKEQKAQQRHSVEVANAGNYLNIRPSTLETLTKSGNSCVNNRRYKKKILQNDEADKIKLQPLPETITVLPPALKCLVYLWEQLCNSCIDIIQSNVLDHPKENTQNTVIKESLSNADRDKRKQWKKKQDEGSWCELCEIFLPIPVTYHMRVVHPGCGKPAKGKGYNSVGMYCEGWAGNCGEGGKGVSSWFLICDACRQKYISLNKNINNLNHDSGPTTVPRNNLFAIKASSLINNFEIYNAMKENALFLLELASYTPCMLSTQRKSPPHMPVVVEDQSNMYFEMNNPSTSRGDSLIINPIQKNKNCHKVNDKSSNASHKKISSSFQNNIITDLNWQQPEIFSCLECLGASMNDELPYEMLGLNSSEAFFERPLSEISFDSGEQLIKDPVKSSEINTKTPLSRFHRSFSMGQGWVNQQILNNKLTIQNLEDPQYPMAVLRRRNMSTNDTDGNSLLCYPSESLRKLIPENYLNASCIVQANTQIEDENISNLKSKYTEENSSSSYFSFNIKNEATVPDQDLELNTSNKKYKTSWLLSRPAISFITQQHDLETLRYAMKRTIRIATCRIFALQALNWLIRSVTQSICLHDLMWWFVSSLSAANIDENLKLDDGEAALEHPVCLAEMSGSFSQLLSDSLHNFLQSVADITLLLPAGSSLQRIAIQCFGIKFRPADHQFLHRSHVFGNISKILSKSDEQNEAMMISSSGAVIDPCCHMEHSLSRMKLPGTKIYYFYDLSGMFEINVSSRQGMAESLVDNMTETFWESDEDDRNRCKTIEISLNRSNYICKAILVHIDNTRDIQNKVLNIVFLGGQSLSDTNLIKTVDIDPKACAWVSAKVIDESYTHFRLELRGSDITLRVRQIKVMGIPITPEENLNTKSLLKLTNAIQIQQKLCEAETLRVFRLLTAQVFGKLISAGNEACESEYRNIQSNASVIDSSFNSALADSLDLREHMVGILFSRSKLSHLQKQVIVHIVHAIRKETQRAKDEWEISNTCFKDAQSSIEQKSESYSDHSRSPDTYCFEMLSMVLALSGSSVGRNYLSHQHGLLKDLLSLLHTGSDRVQRQITALLRRILPEISPENLGDLLGVEKMPPYDFNIVNHSSYDFDMNRLGILDIFLSVIAKSLQLQVKIKSSARPNPSKAQTIVKLNACIDFAVHLLKATKSNSSSKEILSDCVNQFVFEDSLTIVKDKFFQSNKKKAEEKNEPPKNLNQRWFLKGIISVKEAESIISLLRDMSTGKLGDKWAIVTKAAIAESILNLTRLDEIFRIPENCTKTATLWLALASLCVLDSEHVEKLSSGQWSKASDTRPLCNNHDDGETPAVLQCNICGSLCCDCDRFLHLNRKTRCHRRTVCKEEEEAIRVELHESCGRTRLFWLLALADSRTLKAMVEFRDGNNSIISGPQETVGRCRFCGISGNTGLLEIGNICADTQCQEYATNACTKIKLCGHTCGGVATESKCLPCLQHNCHERENENAENLKKPKLTQDADDMCMICFTEALSCAPSIQLNCGHIFHYHCCKMVLEKRWSGPRITFGFSLCPICKADIQHQLLANIIEPINVLKQDVKRKALMRLKYEGMTKPIDTKDLTVYAMDRYAYYVCFKCQKAYYGGEARCDAEIGENFDPCELVCGACSDVARAQMCPKHGTDFLEYKCRYCCSVAVFFCFGTTHFCDTCHDDFQRLTNISKNKLPQCPAGPKAKQLFGEECPLHVTHPPTGEEFALGCGICRNAQTF